MYLTAESNYNTSTKFAHWEHTWKHAFVIYSLTVLFGIPSYLLLPMLLCPVINDLEIPDLHRLSNLQTLSSSNHTEFTAELFFFFFLLELCYISEVILQYIKSMKKISEIFAIQLESGNIGHILNTSGKFFITFNIVLFLHLPIFFKPCLSL